MSFSIASAKFRVAIHQSDVSTVDFYTKSTENAKFGARMHAATNLARTE